MEQQRAPTSVKHAVMIDCQMAMQMYLICWIVVCLFVCWQASQYSRSTQICAVKYYIYNEYIDTQKMIIFGLCHCVVVVGFVFCAIVRT